MKDYSLYCVGHYRQGGFNPVDWKAEAEKLSTVFDGDVTYYQYVVPSWCGGGFVKWVASVFGDNFEIDVEY